jgi:short-subunit dehydrogenase
MKTNAIITGASKGIGKAISLLLAKKGVNLILNARGAEDLKATRDACKALNPKIEVHIFAADVSMKAEVLALGDFCNDTFDQIDILVNNAGIFIPGAIHEEAEGHLEKMIDTNLYSAYHLSRKIIPSMLQRGKGHIFNICSTASIYAYPNGGSYSISKFGLYGMTKVLREELKDNGIRVTAVLPGATWSASWAGADFPEERLMQADDIAKALWSAYELSGNAVIEELLIRPQQGDIG